MLGQKAEEYARDGDRLSNFKRAAALLKCHPARACVGAWSKHLTSILDMVDDLDQGKKGWSIAVWEEKLGDAINYLILLEAIIKENPNEYKSDFSGVAPKSYPNSVLPLGSGSKQRSPVGNSGPNSRSMRNKSGILYKSSRNI
jgi:hypothetical protein